jgi:hypothetical protein
VSIVTAAEFAEIVGKSPAWVSKQIAAGMPVQSRGENGHAHRIDTAEAIGWLLAEADSEQSASDRLRIAQAEKAEFENEIRAGQFITAEQHDAVIGRMAGEIAQQMAAFPGRYAGVLAGVTEPALVRARLIEGCNGVRNAVANHMVGLAGALAALRAEPAEVGADNGSAGGHMAGPMGQDEPEASEG